MKEPKLIKRCRLQHNKYPSDGEHKGHADCEICGECNRAYDALYDKYITWLEKKSNKKK